MMIIENYSWLLYIAQGTIITLKYSVLSVFFGMIIGTGLSLCKLSGNTILEWMTDIYVSVIRGTPLLLQLSLAYYVIPHLTGFHISAFEAGIIAFSMNSGAYVSEIIRAGIQAVDKGQFEAARALSIPYPLMMKDIILPQAIRNILPALVNEMINMVKESSLIAVIGEADLMRRAQIVAAEQYTYFAPLAAAAVCYYIIVMILSYTAKTVEKKLYDSY